MKKVFVGILMVCLMVGVGGCDSGDSRDSGDSDNNIDGIEECETNGLCGGCCSHHGGIACRNGVTVCWDGSPLSDTCFNKGCDGCINCEEEYSDGECWFFRPDNIGRDKIPVFSEKWFHVETDRCHIELNDGWVTNPTDPDCSVYSSWGIDWGIDFRSYNKDDYNQACSIYKVQIQVDGKLLDCQLLNNDPTMPQYYQVVFPIPYYGDIYILDPFEQEFYKIERIIIDGTDIDLSIRNY